MSMTTDKRSLVLITVDCLRADHCGFYGYSRPTTPYLDSLAAESFVVPTAIVGGAPTYYSFPTILASRMPLALGRDVVGLARGESTLASALREAGYATAAFSAANPYISARFGYDQGFNVFHDYLDFKAPTAVDIESQTSPGISVRGKLNRSVKMFSDAVGLCHVYNELYFEYCMKNAPAVNTMGELRKFPAADRLVDDADAWLATMGDRPFFLWLHLMDPHSPYYPPEDTLRDLTCKTVEPRRARYLNEYWNRSDLSASGLRKKRSEVVQLYDAGIRWVDRQIARLVERLKQANLWDRCVLALTADHGEEFLEHGGRYHAPVHLHEELVRVPLVIRVPGKRSGKMPASPMSHLHLAPTLLEIVGGQAPPSFQGRSLWTNLQNGIPWDDPAIIECTYGCTNPFHRETRKAPRLLAVRDERFKLVLRIEPHAREELFDLQTDPAETTGGSEGRGEARRRLFIAAREHMNRTVSARDQTLRLRARLSDLRLEASGA